ncbi:hypothetical protein Tco_1014312 [Tanacetum coccineum]
MERDCQHGLYKAGMGSSRVLSDFAEKYGSKNRVLAGFGIGGKSGKEKPDSTFVMEYLTSKYLHYLQLSSDNQSLLLQYSRDGYVIEGELKDYEDSCEKSSVQIKFKVKDFIQAIKESSCKRRSKLAFENADFEFESRVDTFKDKEIYPVI